MQFKVKAKTMFIDGEAGKTRDHGEVFVASADRYTLMDEKNLVELIEEIEEREPADEETEAVDAEPTEEPVKPKRSRKTTKDDA